MKILGIETSCDETAAAVIEVNPRSKNIKLLSNVISSSANLHAKTGGIIPEIAAREQLRYIIPAVDKAFRDIQFKPDLIDSIAVTVGPGLIGSLIVGVETAKTLGFVWNKPIVPVNHLFGHIYANWLTPRTDYRLQTAAVDRRLSTVDSIEFPAIALIVSGGHTDLVLMKDEKNLKWIGGTRDDAAGEAYDKVGRLLGLSYPAGPVIEKLAKKGNPKRFKFPRPLIHEDTLDFSFSGLKTAVLREVEKLNTLDNQTICDLSFATQDAIIDVLTNKTGKAVEKYNANSVLLGGGVAANQTLQIAFKKILNTKLFAPPKNLCTDNAAMVAAASFFHNNPLLWDKIESNPELYFD